MPAKRPATRGAIKEKQAKACEVSRNHYHNLPAEKRKQRNDRSNEIRKKTKKIDDDRAQNQSARIEALKAEVGGGKARIKDLRDENAALKEAYVLKADEPEVDAAKAKAAEKAFKRAYLTPGLLHKLTHETPKQFDELWRLLEAPLAKINYRGESRARSPGQRQRLPDKVQLFITLFFLRQYPTYTVLSFAVGGLSPLSLHHYIFRVLVALSGLDELAIKWPTDAEMAEHVKKPADWPYPDKRNLVAATDGTEIRVSRPAKYAIGNKHYSAKKKQYALNVLLVVLLSGVIIYCSPPTAKMNDQGLFNDTGVREHFVGKPWGLIGDSGFTLNSKEAVAASGAIIRQTPNKQPKGRKRAKKAAATRKKAIEKQEAVLGKAKEAIGKKKKKRSKDQPSVLEEEVLAVGAIPPVPVDVPSLSPSAKTHNIELSRMCVVVENTNVLGSKLRHYQPGAQVKNDSNITPTLIVKVVAGLTNLHIKATPCRSNAWVPQKVTTDDLASPEGSECDMSNSCVSDADE